METWSLSHRNLQMYCAEFWNTADDCQLILDEIGVSGGRINLSEPSVMRWMSIIRELMRKNDGSMSKLVVVLMRGYPNNESLRQVCAPWIPSTPAKSAEELGVPANSVASPATSTTKVPKGAVLVKKFEDEKNWCLLLCQQISQMRQNWLCPESTLSGMQ